MIVYALLDPTTKEVRYIGKTHRTARQRLNRHLTDWYLKGDTHKERWIRKLLSAGLCPVIVELETCLSASELNEAERRYIALYRLAGAKLTNMTDGGDGGGSHTAESKEKIRQALTGKPKTAQHRLKVIEAITGRKATDATREKLRAIRSRPRSALTLSHRESISRGKGGGPFVDQHGNRYETQKGAARKLRINLGHLNEVLHGTRAHVAGYRFRFINDSMAKHKPTSLHWQENLL